MAKNTAKLTKNKPVKTSSHQKASSSTGVKELDGLLGGGFPRGSVVLLAGSSGSGKTIFAFQWLFEGIKNGENGVYVTLTEPLFKSLKNLENMQFYDRKVIEQEKIKIVDLRKFYAGEFQADKVIDFIEEQVKETGAKRLCIDSVTAIAYNIDDKAGIRHFIFELGKTLASLGCTTLLTSEVAEEGKFSVYNVEEFISDAIVRLDQRKTAGKSQRIMSVVKVRGRAYDSEELDFKITSEGIHAFPLVNTKLNYSSSTERISTGNAELDEMVGGGVFKGSSGLLMGSTGTGKSTFSMQFIAEGLAKGESCLYAGFEESKEQVIRNAKNYGIDFDKYEKKGLLTLRCVYPNEAFLEEHLGDIKDIVEAKGVKRCAVDSLSAVSNVFQSKAFRRFTVKLNGYMKSKEVTTVFTSATSTAIGASMTAESHLSTMADNIIILRYVELGGDLRLVLNVLKIRGSPHSKGLREYRVTENGIVVGQPLAGYEGILTGVTRKVSKSIEEKLREEFARTMGPMGIKAFDEIAAAGIAKPAIDAYIDTLRKDKILKDEVAEKFKERCSAIISKKYTDTLDDAALGEYLRHGSKKESKKEGILSRILGR